MSEEQPFAEENPFLKLDRLQFPKDKKSRKITLEAGKNQKKQKEDSFAVVFDPNLNEKKPEPFFPPLPGLRLWAVRRKRPYALVLRLRRRWKIRCLRIAEK